MKQKEEEYQLPSDAELAETVPGFDANVVLLQSSEREKRVF